VLKVLDEHTSGRQGKALGVPAVLVGHALRSATSS
jgi:hypothetical protein